MALEQAFRAEIHSAANPLEKPWGVPRPKKACFCSPFNDPSYVSPLQVSYSWDRLMFFLSNLYISYHSYHLKFISVELPSFTNFAAPVLLFNWHPSFPFYHFFDCFPVHKAVWLLTGKPVSAVHRLVCLQPAAVTGRATALVAVCCWAERARSFCSR
jgi:hypothetical protein